MYQRKELEYLRTQLENERQSFMSHWRDLADHVAPRRQRFTLSDTNRGDKKNKNIIDSTATLALRTLRSGMMAGITSPARPWFRLTIPDKNLSESQAVKEYLTQVTDRMNTVFLRSNLYNVLPIIYGDIGLHGTACLVMEEDANQVVRFYPFAVGSYAIAQDSTLKVNTFFREFKMTVSQLVEKFGVVENGKIVNEENFSTHVLDLYKNGTSEAWIECYHFIFPNKFHNPKMLDSRYKKFTSFYCEKGTSSFDLGDKHLRMSGFDFFPVLAPRWEVNGEDVYGTDSPAMVALGDIRQLQLGEKRGAQAIDKTINPAMVGPTSMKNARASILAGDITYIDTKDSSSFRPAHEVRFDLTALENKQAQVRDRIRRCFFEDLFLMLAMSDRRQITAREIEERHEEKLLALGPVLEQVNQDLLDPLIDNTFTIMNNQGRLPEPPEEIQGENLKVEYISIMAQAQKLVGIGALERTIGFVSSLAQASPQVLDKIDFDQAVDVYGDLTGVTTGIIRSDDEVSNIRAQREQAQQAQAQAEQAQQQLNAAQQLSQTNVDGENALNKILKQSEVGKLA